MSITRLVVGAEGGSSVVLRDPVWGDEGWSYFVVELHGDGLDVETGVPVHQMRPFTEFWRDLEADWTGWRGERRWESTEPGLAVTAAHDGRHVLTRWTASARHESSWTASLDLLVEPGEELSMIAREVGVLLKGP